MTQVITVTNQKGGVGKTSISSALIAGLHQRGARVLGVDIDPQGNLGFSFGLEIEQGPSIYDVLIGTHSIEEAIVQTEYGDILHTDIMLSGVESEATFPRTGRESMLSRHLNRVKNNYDFIIIDTPPSLNILTINAYVASTGLIVPMEGEVLSLVGISQIQDTIETVRKSFNPELKVLGIVMNKFNARSILNREILELAEQVAEQLGSQVFSSKIRRGVDVAKAPAHGQSVLTYRPDCKPAMDLRKLVDAIAGDQFPRKKR